MLRGGRVRLSVCLVLMVVLASSYGAVITGHANSTGEKTPISIRNGPLSRSILQPAGSSFWFQVGASGDSSSWNFYGASVTIRTVFDQANNDAHSYWVGGYLPNQQAFVQVGYLTTVSTRGQAYCCAWFYEYFPPGNSNCCNPVIGPEFSAGPIGSWHTYRMESNGDQTWSFYMDDKLLTLSSQANATGTTPNMGSNYSGSNNPPAALAEVADASDDHDVLGPGEFRNLMYKSGPSLTNWQPVSRGVSFKDYGKPSSHALPNPYNSVEMHGVDNDFLAGSYLPLLPPSSITFWPNTAFGSQTQLSFHDRSGGVFVPDWISLRDSQNPTSLAFYTSYTSALVDSPGPWLLASTIWHVANVTDGSVQISPGGTIQITSKVYPVTLRLVDYLFSIPVSGALVYSSYPDSVPFNATTNSDGVATYSQIPTGTYTFRAQVQRGLPATARSSITSAIDLTVRVIGTPELVLIVAVPVILGTVILIVAVKREQERRKMWASMQAPPSSTPPSAPEPPSPPPNSG